MHMTAAGEPVLRGSARQLHIRQLSTLSAECVVNIEGAKHGGILNASMACHGGPVRVLANQKLLGPFISSFYGVVWPAGRRPECLLTLVGGSRATFVNSRLHGIRGHLIPGLTRILCVTDNSSLALKESSVYNNNATGVAAFDDARVTLNASTIEHNTVRASGAGMFLSGHAVAVVTNGSSIEGNVVVPSSRLQIEQPGDSPSKRLPAGLRLDGDGFGGGIFVGDSASLKLDGKSTVVRNQAYDGLGGGIFGNGHARVIIAGSCTVGANVAGNASAVAVSGDAHLTITGNSSIDGNYALSTMLDAPVTAYQDSTVSMTGGVRVINNRQAEDKAIVESKELAKALQLGKFFDRKDVLIYPGSKLEMDDTVFGDTGALSMCSNTVATVNFPQTGLTCPSGSFVSDLVFCQCCPASRYSFSTNITFNECRVCPGHATCPGSNRVVPDAGYWHSSPKSVQIHKCPNKDVACGKGGICKPAYAGNLCGNCAPGYGMTLPFTCGQCMSPGQQAGLYALLAFITFAFILVTVLFTYRDNVQGATNVRPSDLIKVLVQFLQHLGIIGSVSAPWSAMLTSMFAASSVVFGAATGQALSSDCWLSLLKLAQPPLAIQRQLVNYVAPIVLFCCVVLATAAICAMSRWFSRRRQAGRQPAKDSPRFARQLPIAAIVVVFYAYPTLVRTTLTFFTCLRIDDPSKQPYPEFAVRHHSAGYWLADMDQECYVGWHKTWAFALGIPAAVGLCLGVPASLLVFLLLAGKRGKVADAAFQERYGFLYRNYTDKCVAWEAVWTVQTVLLTAVTVFHHTINAYYSMILLSVMFLASTVLQAVARPYADRRLHHLHLAATAFLFLTAQCTLPLFTASGYVESVAEPVPVVMGVLLLVINAGFVLTCLAVIVVCAVGPRRKQLAQVAARVFPFCKP